MNRSKQKVKYIVENRWLFLFLSLFIVGGFIFGVKTMDMVKSGKDLDGQPQYCSNYSTTVPGVQEAPVETSNLSEVALNGTAPAKPEVKKVIKPGKKI